MHALTVDLEEWFCSHNLSRVVPYSLWDQCPSRIRYQVELLLNLLESNNVKGTFFTLGWVADRFPDLITTIEDEGHEIGTHGYAHKLTWEHTEGTFKEDIDESIRAISACVLQPVRLFRAPAFSIVDRTTWALEVLKSSGIKIDSSVFPTNLHPEYGLSHAGHQPFQWKNGIVEVPLTCVRTPFASIPASGGAYFRFMGYRIFRNVLKFLERKRTTMNFYIHPWELDDKIPDIKGLSGTRRIRHYHGLSNTASNLEKLLSEFEFGTLTEAFNLYDEVNSEQESI